MSDVPDLSNVNNGSSSTAVKIHEVKSGDGKTAATKSFKVQ